MTSEPPFQRLTMTPVSGRRNRRLSPQSPITLSESCKSLRGIIESGLILVKAIEKRRSSSVFLKSKTMSEDAETLASSLEAVIAQVESSVKQLCLLDADPARRSERGKLELRFVPGIFHSNALEMP
jgi:hypothetical protein